MAFFNDWYIRLPEEFEPGQYLPLWGIKSHVDATIAEAKTDYQDILGLNGAIDRSEIGTGVKYKNREIKMYLVIRDEDIPAASGFADAQAVYEEFARKYHGQNVVIMRSTDGAGGNFQRYKGRLQVAKDSKTKVIRLITCVINADPFVYLSEGVKEIQPTYKDKFTFYFRAVGIVEDGGLLISSENPDGTSLISAGDIGRYAIWNYPVWEDTVIFPYINGNTVSFDIEFFNSDGETITLDGGGYYSDSNDTLKVKITAKTRWPFAIGLETLEFDYIPYSVSEITNADNIRMPSDIYYTNKNEGAMLFLNGQTYPLEVTGDGKYSLFVDGQLEVGKSNWIAVLTEAEEDVDTATEVIINYDNKDLVGVADV